MGLHQGSLKLNAEIDFLGDRDAASKGVADHLDGLPQRLDEEIACDGTKAKSFKYL
jgi:hypothetical protein